MINFGEKYGGYKKRGPVCLIDHTDQESIHFVGSKMLISKTYSKMECKEDDIALFESFSSKIRNLYSNIL